MTSLLHNYLDFVFRKFPKDPLLLPAVSYLPNFYRDTVLFTAFFSVIFFIVPIITKFLFPKTYETFSDRKKREYPSTFACLVHHINVVPAAWQRIFADYQLTTAAASSFNYGAVDGSWGPFCLGYLISDTIHCAIPEALLGL